MPNFLFPPHATETLEQALGNATIAANTSVETALSVGYGVALTGASEIDAFTAKNTYLSCMFDVSCGLGAAGTAFYWLGRQVNALTRVGDRWFV